VAALALAAIPPLGAAWSKEKIVAAAGHASPWIAVLVILAGALSAWYALRYQTLAYGRGEEGEKERGNSAEVIGVWILAAFSILLGLLWLSGKGGEVARLLPGELPKGKPWEILLSIAAAISAAGAAWAMHRRPARSGQRKSVPALVADLWGVPLLIEAFIVRPVRALSRICSVFDKRVVDAGVQGAASFANIFSRLFARVFEHGLDGAVHHFAGGWQALAERCRRRLEDLIDRAVDLAGVLTGSAATRGRGVQTGAIPAYLAIMAGGFFLIWLTLLLGMW
jgi:NADH:ubiquinone oxidoreductase subunit 5 (subunit L)/multisubunit Na+/H+ antiporter MnhA subunit